MHMWPGHESDVVCSYSDHGTCTPNLLGQGVSNGKPLVAGGLRRHWGHWKVVVLSVLE